MKYGILILIIAAALLLLRSQLYSQDTPNGADQDELEMLKEAWKKHMEEKQDENPGSQSSESLDPLEAIEGKMRAIERRLSREDPGSKTQRKQKEALDLLDDLIRRVEEASKPPDSNGGGSPEEQPEPRPGDEAPKPGSLVDPSNPHQPAQPGSQVRKKILKKEKEKELPYGPAGKPVAKPWGKLRLHEKLRHLEGSAGEERPPKYQRLIGEYFKRLLQGLPGR